MWNEFKDQNKIFINYKQIQYHKQALLKTSEYTTSFIY